MTSYQLLLLAFLPFALGAAFFGDGKSSDGLRNLAFPLQDAEIDEFVEQLDSLNDRDLNTATFQDEDEVRDTATAEVPEPSADSNKKATLENIPHLKDHVILESLIEAKREVEDEEKAVQRQSDVRQGARDYLSFHYGSRFQPKYEPARKQATILERTTSKLAEKLNLKTATERQRLHGLQSDVIGREIACPSRTVPKCDPKSPFRSVDGSCNNLRRPLLGSAFSAFSRLQGAQPDYADGISKPRAAKDGSVLPNARLVSFTMFTDENKPSSRQTHMSVVFGHFLANDITHGFQPNINCVGKCNGLEGECYGFKVPANDPHFLTQNVSCFPMARKVPALPPGCSLGPRQQVSDVTAFIDGSAIYGSTVALRAQQRNLKSVVGLLKERPHPVGNLFQRLPPVADKKDVCMSPDPVKQPCFLGADHAINEHQGLMVFHTLWVRESNRITRQMKTINFGWSATRISEETRKIVGAMIQHITYNEYLPEILDKNTLAKFELNLLRDRFFKNYSDAVDPTAINSFGAAAFRMGHSQVQNTFERFDKNQRRVSPVPVKSFFDPSPLYDESKGGIDSLVRGFVQQPAQMVDRFFAKAVQEHMRLFNGAVVDLPATNIQRGRDHGLPGYNTFRKACGLSGATIFDDFKNEIDPESLAKLAKLYKHPDDVDLYVGGILEAHLDGGTMGPTFNCIIAQQFHNLRFGDRFWYEREDPVVGFTAAQLKELRKASLALVLCDNSDRIVTIPRRVLAVDSEHVACDDLEVINLRMWKQRP